MSIYTRDEVILTAKDINLSFGPKRVLSDINFEIKDIHCPGEVVGQVVSLVGRSGMGKSLLIGIISGLLQPNKKNETHTNNMKLTGQILIDAEQKPVKAGDMGIVPQDYFLPEHLKIKDMMMLSALKNEAYKGDKKVILEYIDAYVAAFELKDHVEKYPIQLSGGQKQRASITTQLLNGSNFLLMDEPFSGLDPLMIDKTTNLLRKVSHSDELKTIIIVSHDLPNCIKISDTVYILSAIGREPGTGATIVDKIDLIERGIAYQDEPERLSQFHDTIAEVKTLL